MGLFYYSVESSVESAVRPLLRHGILIFVALQWTLRDMILPNHMQKMIIILSIVLGIGSATVGVGRIHAAAQPISPKKLSGKILLQVESYGRAWYINPADGKRYYLKDGDDALNVFRQLGIGVSNKDIVKIAKQKSQASNATLIKRLSGKILIQTESDGELWYLNPADGIRYPLPDAMVAFNLMRDIGIPVNNVTLQGIPMNTTQIIQDTAFDDVAYVLLRGNTVVVGKNSNQILPPASMSKLVSALVLLDQPLADWTVTTTITQEQIDYPKTLAGDDGTSEIALKAGDRIRLKDLWVAMLVASSNQSTIALVDASGLSRKDFVEAMNKKVKSMGLKKTIFYDPTGLDAHNVTTSYEMALIAKEAFSKPHIQQAQVHTYTITTNEPDARTISVVDRNYNLRPYAPEAVKVGYLVEAQRCVALKRGDDIIVVMHARSSLERNTSLKLLTSL